MTAIAERPARSRILRPADLDDIAMLLLAVFSVGLLIYVWFIEPELQDETWVYVVDTSICGVFFVEFLWRWRAAGWPKSFPVRYWYDVLGMIPVANPALRGLRLLRVIVLGVRLFRMVNRVFGERVTNQLVDRMTDPIIDAIKKPIMVAVLDEVIDLLEASNMAASIADALQENSAELQAVIKEKIKQDPLAGALKLLPFHDQIVQSVIEMSMRVILEVLADPRVGEFVSDAIRANEEQIRNTVMHDMDERELARTAVGERA